MLGFHGISVAPISALRQLVSEVVGGLSGKRKYQRLIIIEDDRFVVSSEREEAQLLYEYEQLLGRQAENTKSASEPVDKKLLKVTVEPLPVFDKFSPVILPPAKPLPLMVDFKVISASLNAYRELAEEFNRLREDEEILMILAALA